MSNKAPTMESPTLHTYTDGSKLKLTTAKTLIQIPIWKGNRVKDTSHIAQLKESIGSNIQHLDKGYHIIKYNETDATGREVEQSYIIDGQHRASVLVDFFTSNLCEPDFPVTYTEVTVNNEAEAIAYFNKINNVKPIHYKEDPILVANRYIEQIIKVLPGPTKSPFFRDKATHRPYMQTEKLREALVENIEKIKQKPEVFATIVLEKNKKLLSEMSLALATGSVHKKDMSVVDKAISTGFALGFDTKMNWFYDII